MDLATLLAALQLPHADFREKSPDAVSGSTFLRAFVVPGFHNYFLARNGRDKVFADHSVPQDLAKHIVFHS